MQEVYLQKYTTEALSLFNKGKSNLKYNNYTVAAYYFQKLLELEPQNFWALRNLGKIATKYKLFPQAINYYQQAIAVVTFEYETELNFIIADLAHLYLKINAVEQAEQILLQRLETQTKCAFLHTSLAEVYENYNPALIQHSITAYKKALALKDLAWVHTKISQHQQLKHTPEISRLSLLLQGNWFVLAQRECNNFTTLSTVDLQQLQQILQTLPINKFTSIENFREFLVEILLQNVNLNTLQASLNLAQQHKLNLAWELCAKCLNSTVIPNVELYTQLLSLARILAKFKHIDAILLQALYHHPTDTKLLITTLELLLTQQQVLSTQTNESIHYQENTALIRLISSELLNLEPNLINELDLDALVLVHQEADRLQLKKFSTLKLFLLNSSIKHQIIASENFTHNQNLNSIDTWITEFFTLVKPYNPETLFDLEYYQSQSQLSDILTIEQAISHYFTQGWQQRLTPHPAFDIDFIEQQLSAQDIIINQPVLLLFLQHEAELNLSPNILINPNKLRQAVTVKHNCWLAYLKQDWHEQQNISDFFDTEFYLTANNKTIDELTTTPIIDFFKAKLADCNRFFHSQFYYQRYQTELNNKPPLVHYLTEGIYLGYPAHPFSELIDLEVAEKIQQLKLT